MDDAEREKILARAATMLREHFDSVQIIACRRNDEGGTSHGAWGDGSWYERYGAVRWWLFMEEERDRDKVRREDRD